MADDDNDGCAEISALDAAISRLFTTNASENQLCVPYLLLGETLELDDENGDPVVLLGLPLGIE